MLAALCGPLCSVVTTRTYVSRSPFLPTTQDPVCQMSRFDPGRPSTAVHERGSADLGNTPLRPDPTFTDPTFTADPAFALDSPRAADPANHPEPVVHDPGRVEVRVPDRRATAHVPVAPRPATTHAFRAGTPLLYVAMYII